MSDDEHWEEYEESFSKRKDRRRPQGRRRVSEMKVAPEAARSSADAFEDAGLQALYERGLLSDLQHQLKSGKEATVYVAEGPEGLLVAKVYRDETNRALKDDSIYRLGRFISNRRVNKILSQSSRRGLSPELALWVFHEYQMLWELHQAGLPVPKPAVGPSGEEIAQAGRVVLMELIGDEDGPAPQLSDVELSEEEAASAWQQSLELLAQLLALGKVHGDYSAYNLLWHDGRIVLIDLPQMVEMERNRHARELLKRDVKSLISSFRRHGIEADPDQVLHQVRQRAKEL